MRRPIINSAALALFAVVGFGCAAPGPSPTDAARPENAAEVLPAKAAEVTVEEQAGFTVTETVSLSAKARADYRDAMRLLEQGSVEAAIDLLEQVVAEAPDATAPHVDLGIAHAHADALDKAEASLLKALRATPDHPVAHNELGIVYRRQGRFAAARESYERALAVFSGFHFARRNLAVLCDLYLADYACALEHYGKYQETVPNDRDVNMWVRDLHTRIAAE